MSRLPANPSPESNTARTTPWRVIFVCSAVALTIATHWPRLVVDTGLPGNDKTVHCVAFGGATFLLWKTRWIASVWLTGVVVLLWSILDEVTQALPGINRVMHSQDMLANAIGVALATLALWLIQRARRLQL